MNQSEVNIRSLLSKSAGKACEEATFGFAFFCDWLRKWQVVFKISLVTLRLKFLDRVIVYNIAVDHKKGMLPHTNTLGARGSFFLLFAVKIEPRS